MTGWSFVYTDSCIYTLVTKTVGCMEYHTVDIYIESWNHGTRLRVIPGAMGLDQVANFDVRKAHWDETTVDTNSIHSTMTANHKSPVIC
jgi:hypothetical protein